MLVFAITCDYPDCSAMHEITDPYTEWGDLDLSSPLPEGWKLATKKDDFSPRYTCPEHGSRKGMSRARAGAPRP